MDDIVKQAMAKWHQVPDCYGWLGLDARGNWYLRDERAQAQGAFASGLPGSKGSRLEHPKLIDFIGRNYGCDAQGRWFFQNGPQKVFVELQSAPMVWRVQDDGSIANHMGHQATVWACVLDETGRLYLQSNLGFGLVHTLDMEQAAQALERGTWQLQEMDQAELPRQFGFVLSPQAQQEQGRLARPA